MKNGEAGQTNILNDIGRFGGILIGLCRRHTIYLAMKHVKLVKNTFSTNIIFTLSVSEYTFRYLTVNQDVNQ